MTAGETIWVIAVREEEYLYVHLFFEQHIGTSQRSMNTRIIAVIEKNYVTGKAVQQSDLMHAQCRTRVGHYIFDATLMHRDNIGISFHHKDTILLGYRLLGLIESIEFALLMIDNAIRRVDIFLADALGSAVEHSSAKSYHLAAHAEPREDGSARETVKNFILTRLIAGFVLIHLEAESRINQIFRIITSRLSRLSKSSTLRERKTQLEFSDDIIPETSSSEISHTDSDTIHIMQENILEIFRRPIVDDKHGFSFALALFFFVGQFTLLNFYFIFLGEPAKSIGIGHLFQFHQKVDCIASLSAGKAMTDTSCWRYRERWIGIVMKRTQADIIDATLLERNKFRYHLFYLGDIHNFCYRRSVYHYIYSFFCFYYAKLLFFFENTKRNGQKSKNETY